MALHIIKHASVLPQSIVLRSPQRKSYNPPSSGDGLEYQHLVDSLVGEDSPQFLFAAAVQA